MLDIVTMIRYENGELDAAETVAFFAGLVASGMAWTLQGFYGRMARDLIDAGYISDEGEVLADV